MNDIPAFPTQIDNHANYGTQGMTLRDYFAIHATAQDIQRFLFEGLTRAQARYAFADVMLRAREAK